ncbi:MAG: hypothetical protein M3R70_00270 [Actinomycetota bacterium]|nr:hypothetical protein [Actinomycetota bacterium]
MRLARLDHTFFEDEVRPQLGQLLLQKGLVNSDELDRALEERNRTGGLLGDTLVRLGITFEDDIGRVLAEQQRVEFVDINAVSVDPQAAIQLAPEIGNEFKAIPVRFQDDGNLLVAVADPLDETIAATLAQALNVRFSIVVATSSAITNAWRRVERRIGL